MEQKKSTYYGTLTPDGSPAKKSCIPAWFVKETLNVFILAWPVALTQFLQYLIFPISTAFVGQTLGTVELDAVSLASTVINVTGLAISCGMATACDTLFSQAYGSGNLKRIGVVLQQGLLLMALACLPCWAIQLNTEKLVLLLGQEAEISYYTGRVVLFFMPGLMANFLFQMFAKYLQNQDIVIPVVISGIVACLVNALSHYVLIIVIGMGVEGSAISQAIAHFTNLFGVIIYISVSGVYKKTWSGWSTEAFFGWGEFIKYAVPGSMMLFLDFLVFEIGIFMAGTLSGNQLAAMSIAHQLGALVYMLPLGCSIACSIRVGQKLGSNNTLGAKRTVKSSLFLTLCIASIVCIIFLSGSTALPSLFSSNVSVVSITTQIMPLLAFYNFFDGIGATLNGALRGCGRHFVGASTIFIGYYGVGLSIGASLMFLTDLQTDGFWVGMVIGVGVNALLLSGVILVWINWEKETYLAQCRNNHFQGRSEKDETKGLLDSDSHDPHPKISIAEVEDNKLNEYKVQDIKHLVIKRLIAVIAVFVVFGIGLLIRFTVEIDSPFILPLNSTEIVAIVTS